MSSNIDNGNYCFFPIVFILIYCSLDMHTDLVLAFVLLTYKHVLLTYMHVLLTYMHVLLTYMHVLCMCY